jgi:hypothetical protein
VTDGEGTIADATAKIATYTAPSYATDETVQVRVTDEHGNVGRRSVLIRVANINPHVIEDTYTDDANALIGDLSKANTSALGWGADGTSEDPDDPAFPVAGARYAGADALECTSGPQVGAIVFSNDSVSTAWFRYYVSGRGVRLVYAESNRCGSMKVEIHRLNPHTEDVDLIDTIYIDQSALIANDVEDISDGYWRKRSFIILFPRNSDKDPDWAEWHYDATAGTVKRYLYRLTFTYAGSGDNTATREYPDFIVNLLEVDELRQDAAVIDVDTYAEWNAGTAHGCTISAANNRIEGEINNGQTVNAGAGRQKIGTSDGHGDADWADGRTEAWDRYVADEWGSLTPIEAGYRFEITNEPNNVVSMKSTAARVKIKRSELEAGSKVDIKISFSDDGLHEDEMPPKALVVQLRRGDPSGSTLETPGTLVASTNYFAAGFLLETWGENRSVTFSNIEADDILQYPDDGGGYTYLWVIFKAYGGSNPLPETYAWAPPQDDLWHGPKITSVQARVMGTQEWYESDSFDLGKIYDFSTVVDVSGLLHEVVTGSGSYSIYWRVSEESGDLSSATWYSTLARACSGQRVRYVQFKVVFTSSTTATVSRMYAIIRAVKWGSTGEVTGVCA